MALAVALAFAAPPARAQSMPAAAKAPSRSVEEARFLRAVDRQNSVSRVTGDLSSSVGNRVAFVCAVDGIVRRGIILGQCGSVAEPTDLFVKMPTEHPRVGQRLHVLGVMETPATWVDVTGHPVYYAFVRAVFVDPLP
jgi:hypothetical protein